MCKNSQLRRNQSHSYASGTCGDLIRSAILPRFLVHFQTVCFHLRIADFILQLSSWHKREKR